MEPSGLIRGRSSIRWWHVVLFGLFIIASGTIALFGVPALTGVVITLFSLLALCVGIIMVVFAMVFPKETVHTVPLLVAGGISAVAALVAILFPADVAQVLVIGIGFLAMVDSILLILIGCALPEVWKTRIIVVLVGMVTLFLGVTLALTPDFALPVLIRIWGIFAWVIGILCLVAGAAIRDAPAPSP